MSPSSTITHSTVPQQRTPIMESGGERFSSEPSVQFTPQEPSGLGRSDGANSPDARSMQTKFTQHNGAEGAKRDVRPFFAGESEGLEFLFDLVAPDRPIRGLHYATPAERYRAKRSTQKRPRLSQQLPSMAIQRELVRTFFLHIWPVLPVVDANEFLTAFYADHHAMSHLLLWSVFFAAASVSMSVVSPQRCY